MSAARPRPSWLRHVVVLTSVAAVLSVACSTGVRQPAQERIEAVERLTVEGRERSYRLLVPATAEPSAPALVVLHDAGGSIDSIATMTRFDGSAVSGGFAVVYPAAAAGGTWNAGFCCGPAPATGIDDLAFLRRVIGEVADHPRIDGDRVYLAGVSNGAILAYVYACDHPEDIGGVASVAGAMLLDDCDPAAPVSILEIHGEADRIVPFEGGELPEFTGATRPVPSTIELVEHWAAVNRCPDPVVESDDPVSTTTWRDCADGTIVRLIAIEGASHTWYASEYGPIEGAVDASATIIGFFDLADLP